MKNNDIFYLTSENDHEDAYNEFLTDSLVEAINHLYAYKEERFICIKVFEKGKMVYRQFWERDEFQKINKTDVWKNIYNREDKYWDA